MTCLMFWAGIAFAYLGVVLTLFTGFPAAWAITAFGLGLSAISYFIKE